MKLTMFDVKESVSAVAVCGTVSAAGSIICTIGLKNLFQECQETTSSGIFNSALQTGVVGASIMLLNDVAHRIHGDGIRAQLPGILHNAGYLLTMGALLMNMYVGAYDAQSEECHNHIWNQMPA